MLADLLARIGTLAWLAVALIAAIIEVSIPHFGFAFVGVGAVAAAVAAYFGFDLPTQFAVLVVVLVVSIALLRSRLVGLFGAARGVPSRTATLVGRHGIVTHDIDRTVGTGRVNVGGEDWAARSTEPIAAGETVQVVGADGIVLEVTKVWTQA
jgi:membrane protein implicated in regulation of membrane protease activity